MRALCLISVVLLPVAAVAQEGPSDFALEAAAETLEAPGRLHLAPDAKVRVGLMTRVESRGRWGKLPVAEAAVVGEDAKHWWVETSHPTIRLFDTNSVLMGLKVRKKDAVVVAAVIGKAGQVGLPIKVPKRLSKSNEKKSKTTVEVRGGVFPAELSDTGSSRLWRGTEGAAKNVVIKYESKHYRYELLRAPKREVISVPSLGRPGGEPFKLQVVKCWYTSGEERWLSSHPAIATLQQGRAYASQGKSRSRVIAISEVAKPRLRCWKQWPNREKTR